MKPWIKLLLAGLIGFGGGFAAGFFAHRKMNDVQFEEITQEEMQEIEAAMQKKTEKAEQVIDRSFATMKDLPDDPDLLRNALQGKTPYIDADKEQKKAYEKLWNATKDYSDEENANAIPVPEEEPDPAEEESPGEEDFDEDFLEMLETEAQEAGEGYVEPPHPITLSEFYNERPEYDKITVDWWQPDDTWTDEREEVIADIRDYVGMTDIRSLFAQNTAEDDPDVRFIRNDRYKSDYELIRHHRSWRETSGGV